MTAERAVERGSNAPDGAADRPAADRPAADRSADDRDHRAADDRDHRAADDRDHRPADDRDHRPDAAGVGNLEPSGDLEPAIDIHAAATSLVGPWNVGEPVDRGHQPDHWIVRSRAPRFRR